MLPTTKPSDTINRQLAKKYTQWAVLLIKSGLTTPNFEKCLITDSMRSKLYSISDMLPILIHDELLTNAVYSGYTSNKSYDWIANIVKQILYYKNIINQNIWQEEYNKALNEPWARVLLNT